MRIHRLWSLNSAYLSPRWGPLANIWPTLVHGPMPLTQAKRKESSEIQRPQRGPRRRLWSSHGAVAAAPLLPMASPSPSRLLLRPRRRRRRWWWRRLEAEPCRSRRRRPPRPLPPPSPRRPPPPLAGTGYCFASIPLSYLMTRTAGFLLTTSKTMFSYILGSV
jgi:hypothetical protein